MAVKQRRTLRDEQAEQTRRRIIDAAGVVFEQHGFSGARFEDIATQAAVAVPTVYKGFSSKAQLLIAAVQAAMAGGHDGNALDQQLWFSSQLDAPDPQRQLALVANNARKLYERSGRLLEVLRAAAAADPQLAATWDEIARARVDRSAATANNLRSKAGPRARLSKRDTAATLLLLTDPALFAAHEALLPHRDGYERWLTDMLTRAILD
jgi:AcrR family transcriptional regulator